MKVDSPSNDMDKVLVFDEQAIGSDDDVIDQDDDLNEEPPHKRICRGKESALSLAMKEVSRSRYASPMTRYFIIRPNMIPSQLH